MKIELLYIPECPSYQPTLEIILDVLREEGLPPDITKVEISDSAQAAALAFVGSPTVRVDGKDVEPGTNLFPPFAVSCRTYLVDGRLQGTPQREWIRTAVLASTSKNET